MANATRYVGWSLGAKVDFSDVERMNRMVDVLGGKLEKVDNRFSGMKMPDNVSRGVQRADDVTASYIRRLESAGKTYEADQEKVKLYDHQIETLTQHQKDLESALGKVADKSGTASDAYAKQKIAINDTATSINRLKSGLSSTQSEMSDLRAKGLDRTAASTSRLKTGWDKLKNAGSELANVGSAISAAMVPVAGAFMEANKQAIKLANEYNVIKNLQQTGGDTAAQARRDTNAIRAENRRLSLKYGVDQNELAAGSEQLIRRGYSGRQDLAAHKYFLQAARASGEDYNTVVAAGAPMLEQFGYKARAGNSVHRMSKYTRDVLNKAAYVADLTAGNIGGEGGFGESFKMMGSIAHSNGQSIDTILGALGTLSNFGQEGSMAGTGMRQIISRLIGTPGSTAKTSALEDLGMKPSQLFNRAGHLKQLTTIFSELRRSSRGMKSNKVSADLQTLFGQTGFNDAQILLRNAGNFRQNSRDSANAARTNYIQRLSRKNMSSLQNQLARTKQLAKDMGMNFAKEVAPGIAKAVGWANKLLKAFNNMPKPTKEVLAYITAGVGAVGASKIVSLLLNKTLGIGSGKGIIGATGDLLFGSAAKKGAPRTGGLVNLVRNSLPSAGANTSFLERTMRGAGTLARSTYGGKLGARMGGLSGATSAGKAMGAAVGAGVAVSSGIDIFKAIKSKNPTAKFKNFGRGIGTAVGGGIGGWLFGPAGAAIGASIGKVVGGWAGKAAQRFSKSKFGRSVGHTFHQAVWSAQQSLRPLGRTVNGTVRSVSRSFGGMSRDIGKDWRDLNRNRDFRQFKNFLKSGMVATLRFTIREIGTLFKTGVHIITGAVKMIASSIKGIVGVVRGTVKFISDALHGRWGKAWKDAKGIVNSAVSGIRGIVKGLKEAVGGVLGGLYHTAKNIWDFVSGKDWKVSGRRGNSTSVHSANAAVGRMQNGQGSKHHASASHATTIADINRSTRLKAHANGTALVGEAGPELAYKPYGKYARILGANGPQLAHVKNGERILSARDTRKVMAGGLGRGLVLKGYASGTAQLGKTAKTVTGSYKKITDQSSRQLDKLNKHNKSTWSSVKDSATKQVTSLQHSNNSTWGKITSQTNKQTDKTRKNSIADYTNMRKGIDKQMDAMHTGVINTAQSTTKGFGKAMGKMDNYAHSAMSNTMKQLNQGIRGIDKVLSQFGGNGDVIKTVHFANGSDAYGRLTHNTLAMVNDATSGPRQEALVSDKNDLIIPHGDNRRMVIPQGWGVLNGYQTQSLAHSMGLQHFASGSGVSHSTLRKIASRGQSDPAKSFSDYFTSHVQEHAPTLEKGTTGLGKHSSTHYGVPWMAAMWNVINDAIGGANGKGGTREAFLKYAEATFSGVPYQMGAASKRLSDCSGMVMQALRHFGINIGRTTVAMQNSSGVQYLGKSLSKTLPGDLVIYGHGTGAAGHVGIIKNPKTHTMFNETKPRATVSSIDTPKSMGYGYYRVRGLHNAKPTKQMKASNRLETLAKQELGKPALSWIKKHLSDSLGSLGSFAIGGDIGDRARVLARALRKLDPSATKNGIAAVLGNWEFESGGLNPGITNGGNAAGLGQWLGGRKANLIAYARRHGTSWKNAATQLNFALKGDTGNTGILRSVLEGHGSIADLATKFSREWERGGYDAQHVHGAMIVRKALGYAKGGTHHGSGRFLVGEQGPEVMSVGQDAKIDSFPTTKKKLTKLADILKPIKATVPKLGSKSIGAPHITININGPISSSHEAKVVGDQIQQKIVQVFEQLGDDLGTDPSVY